MKSDKRILLGLLFVGELKSVKDRKKFRGCWRMKSDRLREKC